MKLELAGEPVWLLAERALYAETQNTLYVADVHIGKTAALRAQHVPVPAGTTTADLCRLSALIQRTGAEHLAILGDLLHAREGRQPATLQAVSQWRRQHPDLKITLVRGNHDTRSGDPPAAWAIECVASPHAVHPFILCHSPCINTGGYTLAGHVHPAVKVRGRARESLRLPCFCVGDRLAILPAFGSFTGTAYVEREPGGRVFAIAGDEIIEV